MTSDQIIPCMVFTMINFSADLHIIGNHWPFESEMPFCMYTKPFCSHCAWFSVVGSGGIPLNFNTANFCNKTPWDSNHILYQSDERGLCKMTKLLCIGQNKYWPFCHTSSVFLILSLFRGKRRLSHFIYANSLLDLSVSFYLSLLAMLRYFSSLVVHLCCHWK